MNKRTIDNDVYERYIDATVALFMEYYSVAFLPESINAEFNLEENGIAFPTELDNRCRQLIRKELSRYRRKQNLSNLVKGLKYVAACFIAFLSLSSFLFMTVEAIRIPIINYYISQHDGHWEIFGQTNGDSQTGEINNAVIDIDDPLAQLIPDEYQLSICEGEAITDIVAIYENNSNNRICFSSSPGEHWIAIDSENAQTSRQHKICGYDAITVIKDDSVSLTWINTKLNTVFTLIADSMSDSEVSAIAEQLINRIN